jgi:hypothetical protein
MIRAVFKDVLFPFVPAKLAALFSYMYVASSACLMERPDCVSASITPGMRGPWLRCGRNPCQPGERHGERKVVSPDRGAFEEPIVGP